MRLRIGEMVAIHGVKDSKFTTMQLSDRVKSCVDSLNASHGKKPAYGWEHIKDGFIGGFYKYIEGVTPVMKSEQVKDYLALLYCLIREGP